MRTFGMGDISKHFRRSEFACKCGKCDFDTVDTTLLNVLEEVRGYFGKPVTITSGCRCESHNKDVGGSQNSQHLYGRAADIVVAQTSPQSVYDFVNLMYPLSLGLGLYSGWVHIDSRNGKARWK
jgi:uncharacterized protein YcbK (DUF882 family)